MYQFPKNLFEVSVPKWTCSNASLESMTIHFTLHIQWCKNQESQKVRYSFPTSPFQIIVQTKICGTCIWVWSSISKIIGEENGEKVRPRMSGARWMYSIPLEKGGRRVRGVVSKIWLHFLLIICWNMFLQSAWEWFREGNWCLYTQSQ